VAELYTFDEVADKLRISRRTVERLAASGRIRVTKIGRRSLVTDRELDAYLGSLRRRYVA